MEKSKIYIYIDKVKYKVYSFLVSIGTFLAVAKWKVSASETRRGVFDSLLFWCFWSKVRGRSVTVGNWERGTHTKKWGHINKTQLALTSLIFSHHWNLLCQDLIFFFPLYKVSYRERESYLTTPTHLHKSSINIFVLFCWERKGKRERERGREWEGHICGSGSEQGLAFLEICLFVSKLLLFCLLLWNPQLGLFIFLSFFFFFLFSFFALFYLLFCKMSVFSSMVDNGLLSFV